MGRSRGVANNAGDEELGHRSKRRKAASSAEALENVTAGSGSGDGKKALYHCNYCNKDISGKIRIKCTKCPDFDLCLECFTVGAEVHPHKSNHPYRVMDSLSFPLFSPDWNADEEILLLEGIEMYGLGNWAEVAEHVGTKNKGQCIDHYTAYYVNSPCYPLPNMAHVVGKNRKELIAMAKGHGDGKKGFPLAGETTPKEDSPFSPSRVKLEDLSRETPTRQSPSNIAADGDSVDVKGGVSSISGASKKASRMMHAKEDSDRVKVEGAPPSEESHVDRSVGVKKPKSSGEETTIAEMSGFNPKRQEFDPEYDMDAEQSLAEMEFKETDSETDRELKLRVLHIYYSRLDERKRRKDFILERNLLYPSQFEKELCSEDREIYERYKVFMRFQSQKEHEELVRTLIEERRIRKRIQELQECKAAGCRTRAEAETYLADKAKREEDTGARKGLIKPNRPAIQDKEEPTPAWDEWDVTGLPGADLLSESEQQLCSESRLLPSHFLKMQEVLAAEMMKGKVQHRADARGLFKVDPGKVDRVYGLVSRKLGKREEPAVA
ncbi:transcriptional adapter ADA2-like [Wolffia australiana]